MGRLTSKLLFATVAALFGVALLYYQQNRMQTQLRASQEVQLQLHGLYADTINLQYTVLKANYFLYYNNDDIVRKIERIRKRIESLLKNRDLERPGHIDTRRGLLRFRHRFETFAETIHDFLTLNASLKNSSIYLPTLALKAYDLFSIDDPLERQIILTLSRINARLFLAKNALDESFVKELEAYRQRLARLLPDAETKPKRRLLETSIRHLELFIRLFPRFHADLQRVQNPTIHREIGKVMRRYAHESAREFARINRIGEILLALYLFSIGVVVYFVFRAEREAMRLRKAKEELQRLYLTDTLTGLGNREAFRRDLPAYRHPALILVNVDRFKHINEFYGTVVGDHLLQAVAERLKEAVPAELKARFYRMGGDDFGILLECEEADCLRDVMERILRAFEEQTFTVDSVDIDLSVTLGASDAGAAKLFETADMALKNAKSSRRRRYALYDPSMDISETIAGNIQSLRRLKSAIANDAVIPYFQPIVDLRTGKVQKYEALARLRVGENETLSPYHFIEVAKQAKLSGVITGRILEKTLMIAGRVDATFSVNVSAEDVGSESGREEIYELLERHADVAGRIAFEILETEEIDDYEAIAEFIRRIRRYGCGILIDDFGSGYSNFEKLLQLEIDTIKIDGTLIRDVDHNSHAELVVQTIVDFAKGAQLLTVAEFVHSAAVLEKVEALGIDFAQGYYLGEPRPPEAWFGDTPGPHTPPSQGD